MKNLFKVVVSGFVKNEDGKLLIIRRSPDEEYFAGMLAIPGGTVETNLDSGIDKAAIEKNLAREILEETNVNIEVSTWEGSTINMNQDTPKIYLFFNCKLVNDGNELQTSPETPEVFWADINEINIDECAPTLREYLLKNRSNRE